MRFTFTPLLLSLFSLGVSFIQPVSAQVIYGLSRATDYPDFTLLSFDVAAPSQLLGQRRVTGLNGFRLTGIEIQPATGSLYALGTRTTTSTEVQLFGLDAATGVATAIGTPTALGSSSYTSGFCFDPFSGEVRLVGSRGENYRLNPSTGALLSTDTSVSYAASDLNAGQTVSLTSLAFNNNLPGSQNAQLYGLDGVNNRLVALDTPGNGALRTIGNLGVNISSSTSALGITTNATGQNSFYLLNTEMGAVQGGTFGIPRLYSVNPVTGQATLIGPMANQLYIYDLAVSNNAIISATRDRRDLAQIITVAPNPARSGTSLQFNLSRAGRTELTVCDNLGRTVVTVQATLPSGTNSLRWNAGMAQPGLYLLRLAVDGQPVATRRVVLE